MPICKDCNRKKKDKLPFNFLDEKTYKFCFDYLESVLIKITNHHDDKLQREEITSKLLNDYNIDKINIDELISSIFKIYNINKTYNVEIKKSNETVLENSPIKNKFL